MEPQRNEMDSLLYRAHRDGFAVLRNDELLRGSVSLWEY